MSQKLAMAQTAFLNFKIWTKGAVFFLSLLFVIGTALSAQSPSDESNSDQEAPPSPEATSSASTAGPPGTVSIDFKDADINNVLRILSLKSGVNIVAGPEVTGTVTIRLENVPWEKALDVVLRTYGYVYERKENIVRVTTKENLSTEELITETFVLNYTTAKEVEESLKDIVSERGRIKSVERSNMLVVTDIPTNLYKIREVVAKLDKSTPQAHIDAKIIKTQLQQGENLGIKWEPQGTLKGSQKPLTFPFNSFAKVDEADPFERVFSKFFPNINANSAAVPTAGTPNIFNPSGFPTGGAATLTNNTYTLGTLDFTAFQAVLNFFRSRANTKVISNPRITVLNNQKATIRVAKDIPYPQYERNETTGSFEISGYDFKPSGVKMEVTPHINDANEILVDLEPEVTSIPGGTDVTTFTTSATAALQSLPNINTTTAKTQVLIRSGETIAIGGLMTDAVASAEQKVPVLGDIPFVGKIFRSKRREAGTANEKAETLFFVTVTVVDTQGEPTTSLAPKTQVQAASGQSLSEKIESTKLSEANQGIGTLSDDERKDDITASAISPVGQPAVTLHNQSSDVKKI
ncbi:MAG: hypothetical protein A3C35_05940 [Omnitrophica bacterium RIFCSPHIGHO2_02_FULL_46_11]|nr:MAG: hypothetical protein A3C35_05940 [Omnitrophica bacterium RIFCSPHIGHO2_02_FULL_46_11]OGW86342.1 MAG: hypothetical protein A3A81_07660 [Omnitrophica bacterium RIFCSPLOWO2_01_FULL_45_10b]